MAAGPVRQLSREVVIVRESFWRGRRVLVTGHTGFKGAWLCLWLQIMGAQVTGYALPPATRPNLFVAARLARGMRSLEADVRDLPHLEEALRESRAEVVLHLAAQPIVRRSYDDPVGTFSTNVLGTVHALEAVRQAESVRSMVVVTSDKCYENREWHWPYREKSALGGRDPYSASKACAELVASAYRRSYFDSADSPEVATARAGNVIGGGDWAEARLVPDTIRSLEAGEPVELRYPEAVRPWQHVLDPLAGYLALAERLHGEDGAQFAEAWNFAPAEEDARAVGWLVERLQEGWGIAPRWRPQDGPRPHEHIYLKLDASKARARLGWVPRLTVSETVAWTVEWYRRFGAGEDARDLAEEQIHRYLVGTEAPAAEPASEQRA
ncbi:MAG TPA: CDP-glucose 4,6-dehydratase [Thermoanaerobaculia bacterium]|nr:CDP-glucose 4,6-dehydratase [Thermoanaerobaculia bacterium]